MYRDGSGEEEKKVRAKKAEKAMKITWARPNLKRDISKRVVNLN